MTERKVVNFIAQPGWVGAVAGMFVHRWAQKRVYDAVVARYTRFPLVELTRLAGALRAEEQSGVPPLAKQRRVILFYPDEDLEFEDDWCPGAIVFDKSWRTGYAPVRAFFRWLFAHRYMSMSWIELALREELKQNELERQPWGEREAMALLLETDEVEYALTSYTRDHPKLKKFDFQDFHEKYQTIYKEAPRGEKVWPGSSPAGRTAGVSDGAGAGRSETCAVCDCGRSDEGTGEAEEGQALRVEAAYHRGAVCEQEGEGSMNDFTSVIRISYKDGDGYATVKAVKDGEIFSRTYDPSDEKAEKEAMSGLAEFLGGQVSEDGKAIEVEVGEKAEDAKEPEVDLSEVKPFKMDQVETETETASGDPVYHIRPTDEIEELLNRAGNTASDMDDYIAKGIFSGKREDMEKLSNIGVGFSKKALEFMGKEFPTDSDTIAACETIYGVHLTNLIDRLCWALDNTLNRYEKAKYRLRSWGDVTYVADLEDDKI